MLKKFTVRNYKNFQNELVFDFANIGGYKFNTECICNEHIGKAIIYGKNASGKTNLGRAIIDIVDVILGNTGPTDKRILNADAKETLIYFTYEFLIDGKTILFLYTKNQNNQIVSEKLEINGETVYAIERITTLKKEFNLKLIDAESLQIDKYFQMLYSYEDDDDVEKYNVIPFIRYILNNVPLALNNALKTLERFVSGMRMFDVADHLVNNSLKKPDDQFLNALKNEEKLTDFERFLNEMGIECELEVAYSADGRPQLYFRHNTPVPFYENASSGTLYLTSLYQRIIFSPKAPTFIYLDEFDAFYHFEMSDNMLKFLKSNYQNCQIVMTTHNTNLMNNQLMRPDCLFILAREGKLTPLCDATERELREGHNLEKLYIAGEFQRYE